MERNLGERPGEHGSALSQSATFHLCPALSFPFVSWCEWDVCVHGLEISQCTWLAHPVQLTTTRAVVACTARHPGWRDPGAAQSTRSDRRARPLPHHLYLLFSNTATRLHTESCFSQARSILLACKVVLSYPRIREGGNQLVPSALPGQRVKQGYHSQESAHLF